MDAKDLVKQVKEDGVKFISLQFTDVTGSVKSVDMPISGLDGALEDGVWFDLEGAYDEQCYCARQHLHAR